MPVGPDPPFCRRGVPGVSSKCLGAGRAPHLRYRPDPESLTPIRSGHSTGQRSPRKLLAAVVRRLLATYRRSLPGGAVAEDLRRNPHGWIRPTHVSQKQSKKLNGAARSAAIQKDVRSDGSSWAPE
jgi:hypothetical protein